MTTVSPVNAELSLEFLARLTVTLGPAFHVGGVPSGQRRIVPITGGSVQGGLTGEVVPGGADWFLWRPGDIGVVSARYCLRTADGVVLTITNEGSFDPASDLPCPLTAARIEAPVDSAYAWLNLTPLVGTLVAEPGNEEYVTVELWRVTVRAEPHDSRPSGA